MWQKKKTKQKTRCKRACTVSCHYIKCSEQEKKNHRDRRDGACCQGIIESESGAWPQMTFNLFWGCEIMTLVTVELVPDCTNNHLIICTTN